MAQKPDVCVAMILARLRALLARRNYREQQRLDLIECEDAIKFLEAALATQQKKRARIVLAISETPADLRRACREPV